MTTKLAPDGSPTAPAATFDGRETVIAVLTLNDLAPGTKLSYVRYLDGKFVDSKSANLKDKARYFYFRFSPNPGARLTPGHYLLRLYVSDSRVTDATYDVSP